MLGSARIPCAEVLALILLLGCGTAPDDDDDDTSANDDDDTSANDDDDAVEGPHLRFVGTPWDDDLSLEGAIWAITTEEQGEFPGGVAWQVLAGEGVTCERYIEQIETVRAAAAQWDKSGDLAAFEYARRVAFAEMVKPGWFGAFGALRPAQPPPEGEIPGLGPTKFAGLTDYISLSADGHEIGRDLLGYGYQQGAIDSLAGPVTGWAEFDGQWTEPDGSVGDQLVRVEFEAEICVVPEAE